MAGLLEAFGQTWPARMARGMARGIVDAVKLPGDVYQGNIPMSDNDGQINPEIIARSAGLAGMIMGGTGFTAPAGAVGAGPTRLSSEVMDLYRNGGAKRVVSEIDDDLDALIAERIRGATGAAAKRQKQLEKDIAAGRVPAGSEMTFAETQQAARHAAQQAADDAAYSAGQSTGPRLSGQLDSEVMRLFRERGGI